MIGYLSGKIVGRIKDQVLVDVGGVGYRVQVDSGFTIQDSGEVSIFVYTHVREDQISLFGFESKKQLELFELLIGVNGVGPKVGMAILSSSKADLITAAIAKADVGFFTAVPGIGKKGAQKIIIDLKNKVGSVSDLDLSGEEQVDELVEALVGMGFDAGKASSTLAEIDVTMDEQLRLKMAIKKLSKNA